MAALEEVIKRTSSSHTLTEMHHVALHASAVAAAAAAAASAPCAPPLPLVGGLNVNIRAHFNANAGVGLEERMYGPSTCSCGDDELGIPLAGHAHTARCGGVDAFVAEALLAEFDDYEMFNVEKRPVCEKWVSHTLLFLLTAQLAHLLLLARSSWAGLVFVPFVLLGMSGAWSQTLWHLLAYITVYAGRTLSLVFVASRNEIPLMARRHCVGCVAVTLLVVSAHILAMILAGHMVLSIRRDVIKRCHA